MHREHYSSNTLHSIYAYKRAAKRPATIKKPAALLEDAAPVKATVEFFGPPGKTPVADPVLYGLVATVVAGHGTPPAQTATEIAAQAAPTHGTAVEAAAQAAPTHGTAVEAGHEAPTQTGALVATTGAEDATQLGPGQTAAPVGTPVDVATHGTPLHMATEVAVIVTVE